MFTVARSVRGFKDQLRKVVVVKWLADAVCVTGIQVVKMDTEIAQQEKFARAEAVVVNKSRKFFVREWGCICQLGWGGWGGGGGRSVEAGEDDRFAKLLEKKFVCFKGASGKGWAANSKLKNPVLQNLPDN